MNKEKVVRGLAWLDVALVGAFVGICIVTVGVLAIVGALSG